MPVTGAHHVTLTVTDLERSKAWYASLLDWQQLFDGDESGIRFAVGMLPSGLILGFRQSSSGAGAFDPAQVGLDHLAFGVPARAELATWEQRFADLGVVYTKTIDVPYGHVLNFKDPDGIALELFAMSEPGE